MDLLPVVLTFFEDHVFEDVKQVVDTLAIQLGVLISVSIQVVLRYFLGSFGLEWISSHVNYRHCAHR